ncbi:PH domain-containing protein [Clostridium gasigenes]|uniref:PH domain-containing protein n=1 Tax=Clostridium gasigenes TaxID=94869 RepID=UPI00143854DC|nr:PH domain-containing protein [Clostridium gasigenes]NKF08567.1 PH domain-containing protein [Clostridium gasigenes]QSW19575.1 PH domain-containing protein [Clostridium gasigenes]
MGLFSGVIGNASEANLEKVTQDYGKLLGSNEQIEKAYKLIRDMIIFTNKRLIVIDKQGLTGKKVEYHSVPYRAITNFKVETAGHFDLDAELKIFISGSSTPIQKTFGSGSNIYEVQAILAEYCEK